MTAIVDPSWPEEERFLRVAVLVGSEIAVSNQRRSVDFYARLFGLQRSGNEGVADARNVLLSRGGRIRLVLCAHDGCNSKAAVPPARLTAVVRDLDRARSIVWDLGIPLLREAGNAFVVRDPDGHEITVVERCRIRPRSDVMSALCV